MAWQTHDVFNQVDEWSGYNLFATDTALAEAVQAGGAGWSRDALEAFGVEAGSVESFAQAISANHHQPELQLFDARGRRTDSVEFHPAWHAHMARYRQAGGVSRSHDTERAGRWAAQLAFFYMQAQVEAGSGCPATMTWAAIPLLRREPALWALVGDKLLSADYDPRDLPIAHKRSIYIGMGMTEKQGGSDVRANTTSATPAAINPEGGRGATYLIRGHKWFFSAPMCDAHLVVAQIDGAGPSCFFVPRWRADGSKNPVQIQRLKDKVGNKSNASSEVEFLDAEGILMGELGRGIPTIIEMANYTRLNCVTASAGFIRQALVQGLAYTRQRQAFGRPLAQAPLMRAVLADLAIESEAALALTMRLARAFEHDEDDPGERLWKRLVTPAAKFWICKRAVELTGEAMEIFGGNGYVETGSMGRLFREAPVNSIWEGSGNVMCLDVIRAFAREPQAALALFEQLRSGAEPLVQQAVDALVQRLADAPDQLEAQGRLITQQLVLLIQARLLRETAPGFVADAFVATRLAAPHWGRVVGALDPSKIDVDALLARALPV